MAGLLLGVANVVAAVWLLRQGSRPAGYFLVAFGALALGGAAYIFTMAKLLPAHWLTLWGVQIGSLTEALVLALGLADSFNRLRAGLLDAERREREAQHRLASELGEQVRVRTQALEQANRRLAELAVTDALTGAFNRRHYNDFCRELLAGRPRGEALAFCMFDLDHFKAYNDRYGHQAGDEVLRTVVAAVQAELKRSGDVLFRLGGEEFGVIYTAPSAAAAATFVERLRQVIRGLHIAHAASEAGVVTASFGMSWWSGEALCALTPDSMYARADRLLYEAKAAGRDRYAADAADAADAAA